MTKNISLSLSLFLLYGCDFEILQTPTKKHWAQNRGKTPDIPQVYLGKYLLIKSLWRNSLYSNQQFTLSMAVQFCTNRDRSTSYALPNWSSPTITRFKCLTAVRVSLVAAKIHRIAPTFGCKCHRSGPGSEPSIHQVGRPFMGIQARDIFTF